MSVRGRLLAAALVTLVVGLGALIVAGNVLLDRRVAAETSTLLRVRTEAQLASVAVEGSRVTLRASRADEVLDRRAWVLAGERLVGRPSDPDPELDAAAVRLGRAGRTVEREVVDDVRMRATPIRDDAGARAIGAVVVGVSIGPLERLRQEVLLGSLVIAGLIVLAVGLVIRSALDGALRPVVQMTAAAQAWGAEDLDRRFDLGPAHDELTGLAVTLDGLLGRISASRRHEQRLAGEIAHELRTPLAKIRGRAELALRADGPERDEARVQALTDVVAQVAHLDAAVSALLAVARGELDATEGSADLAALAAEHDDVTVEAHGGLPPAEGAPDVVRRALAPLVENARRHARTRVWIELCCEHGRVCATVCDDGPGVKAGMGDRAFDPGVRGDGADHPGAGLGLPLARRLARSCGGDVRLIEGAGGRFVLELPALGGGA